MEKMFEEDEEIEHHSPLYTALKPLSTDKTKNIIDEWRLFGQSKAKEYGGEVCVCGHPILYMFHIRNLNNKTEVVIGSCCMNQIEAKSLKPKYKGKKQYLETAQKLAQTQEEKNIVGDALTQFKKWGSKTKLSKAKARILEKITGHRWKSVW